MECGSPLFPFPTSPIGLRRSANGAGHTSLGQRPRNHRRRTGQGWKPGSEPRPGSRFRWDGPSALDAWFDCGLGRWPRLVWWRAFGPAKNHHWLVGNGKSPLPQSKTWRRSRVPRPRWILCPMRDWLLNTRSLLMI